MYRQEYLCQALNRIDQAYDWSSLDDHGWLPSVIAHEIAIKTVGTSAPIPQTRPTRLRGVLNRIRRILARGVDDAQAAARRGAHKLGMLRKPGLDEIELAAATADGVLPRWVEGSHVETTREQER